MPWLTGDTPNGYVRRVLFIPNDSTLLQSVNGALLSLCENYNWEKFGSLTPDDCAELMWEMWLDYMNSSMIGQIFVAATANPPQGALWCEGQILQRSAYPLLYEALDPAYHLSSSEMVLPDLRGRFVLGASGSRHFASSGGAETVTLTTAQMPSHTHDTLPHAHTEIAAIPTLINGGLEAPAQAAMPSSSTTSVATVDVLSTGGGQAHENMPPYVALRYAIWVS